MYTYTHAHIHAHGIHIHTHTHTYHMEAIIEGCAEAFRAEAAAMHKAVDKSFRQAHDNSTA